MTISALNMELAFEYRNFISELIDLKNGPGFEVSSDIERGKDGHKWRVPQIGSE